jgi:tetratricopeptide (TPR) repeat protein
MNIALNTPARKRTAAAIVLVIAAAYSLAVTRGIVAVWLFSRAAELSGPAELTSLRRAAWLDPGNADYRYHLGRYYDLAARDPRTAVVHYSEAVRLNPHAARYWFDLASAYQVLGDRESQTASLERAIQADPMTPDVAWEAANLYLVRGENEKALREFSVVMANDTSLAATSIQFCWRVDPDVDSLLRDVVPRNPDAYTAFLAFLQMNADVLLGKVLHPSADNDTALLTQQLEQETAGTFKVWDALMQTSQPFEVRYVYDYIRFLILHKEVDEAVLAWQQATARFDLTSYRPSSRNLVVNGNFSLDVLNNGFDWHYERQPGVSLMLEHSTPQPSEDAAGQTGTVSRLLALFGDAPAPRRPVRGARPLMIAFDGPSINDAGLYQYVPVQPNTTYEFSAHYKNKGEQEGAGGPHLTIQDQYTQAVYYESDELKENSSNSSASDSEAKDKDKDDKDNDKDEDSWKLVNGEFTTAPDCKLVVLHIRRLPEGLPIRGKLWIDDLRLVQKPS